MSVANEWGTSAEEALLIENWFAEGETGAYAQAATPEDWTATRGLREWFGSAMVAMFVIT
jgi:hypothetical protein